MDDRNKNLPLIVAEILIEMHEMKEDIREMRGDIQEMNQTLTRVASVVVKQQEHTNTMFNTIQEESRKNVEFMTSLMKDFRQENIQLAADIRRESQEDRQFMTYSINKALGQQQQLNASFEKRLAELEAKYNG